HAASVVTVARGAIRVVEAVTLREVPDVGDHGAELTRIEDVGERRHRALTLDRDAGERGVGVALAGLHEIRRGWIVGCAEHAYALAVGAVTGRARALEDEAADAQELPVVAGKRRHVRA